ncbi:MAG TPA: hypothetical protein VF695_09835 [Sphingomonas sp.]|jgi:hypothetical protein
MADRYIRRAEASGWTLVRLTKSNALVSLCEYTHVIVKREAGGRTYFVIADGYVHPGEEASLSSANAAKYLATTGPGGGATLSVKYRGPPEMVYSPVRRETLRQQWAELSFGSQFATVTLNSIWNSTYTPIQPGTHNILAPDASHANVPTSGYVAATPGMVGNDTWFPIALGSSMENSTRYIHVGHLSEGCVTVYQLERWTALYNSLIANRVPGTRGRKVGTLVVRK